MAKKADELIKLRNDGMAYALKIAEEYGVDGLREQVKLRGASESIREIHTGRITQVD